MHCGWITCLNHFKTVISIFSYDSQNDYFKAFECLSADPTVDWCLFWGS